MLHRVLIPVQILFTRRTDKLRAASSENIIKKKEVAPEQPL